MLARLVQNLALFIKNFLLVEKVVIVSRMAGVTGDGSTGNPYTGVPAAIGNGIPFTTYRFPKGDYALGVDSIAPTATDITLEGRRGANLKYTGVNEAVIISGRKRGTITVTGATGGTITLKVRVGGKAASQTTTTLSNVATAAQVVSALNALSNVVSGVTATGGPLGTAPIVVSFPASLGYVKMVVGTNALTGGAAAVSITANLGDASGQINSVIIRDLEIDGGTTADCGLYLDFTWVLSIRNLKIRNLAQTTTSRAVDLQFALTGVVENVIHTLYADTLAGGVGHMAYIGLNLGSTTVEDPIYPPAVCNCAFINLELDSARFHGLWAQNTFSSNFIDGNYTASGGTALQIENKCNDLLFNGPDLENGASQLGLYCDAVRCTFKNMVVYSGLTFTANAFCNTIENGRWGTLGTVTDNGDKNRFIFVNGITAAAIQGTGTARQVYEDTTTNNFMPSLTITDKNGGSNQFLHIFADTTGVAGNAAHGTLQFSGNRPSHVQLWQVGLNLQNFNSLVFSDVTGGVVPLALNENNGGTFIGASGGLTFNVPAKLASYTVGTLPAGSEGQLAKTSNGRKVGEGAGLGTGVDVYYSSGQWRVHSTDLAVAA